MRVLFAPVLFALTVHCAQQDNCISVLKQCDCKSVTTPLSDIIRDLAYLA